MITLYPGRAAEEVERQVTILIETALAGTPNSVRVFSHTQFGLSFMMVTFNDKATDVTARQQIIERLRSVDLPDGVHPDLAPLSTAIGEIYRFRLTGKGYSPQELRTLQDWVVEKNLRQVPGVADLVTIGGSIKQYEVNSNLARMRDAGISLSRAVHGAPARQLERRRRRGGAWPAAVPAALAGRLPHLGPDIANVVVSEKNGTPILVRDIAEVKVGSAPPQGLMGQDDEDDIVSGIVVMRKGENPSIVLDALKQKIDLLDSTHPAQGREDRAVLRPLHADRQDPAHGVRQPGGRRAAGDGGAVPVPGQRACGGHRGAGDSAGAALHLHRPDLGGHSGQPAVARRDGLRHHRGRRGDRGGEHLQAAGRAEGAADPGQQGAAQRHPAGDDRGGPADRVLDGDHHRGAHPDLHAAAPRGQDLRADGLYGDRGADRLADHLADRWCRCCATCC